LRSAQHGETWPSGRQCACCGGMCDSCKRLDPVQGDPVELPLLHRRGMLLRMIGARILRMPCVHAEHVWPACAVTVCWPSACRCTLATGRRCRHGCTAGAIAVAARGEVRPEKRRGRVPKAASMHVELQEQASIRAGNQAGKQAHRRLTRITTTARCHAC
jgi:hypothetical protein